MGAYEKASAEHKRLVDQLLADTRAHNGLAPLDVERFWADQAVAKADPFGKHIPQTAFGAILSWECVFDELGVGVDYWRFMYEEDAWVLDLKRRYNDLAERIVGLRLLGEAPRDPQRQWPAVKELSDIFEAQNVWEGGPSG